MPNDAKFGLVVGVGLVIAVAVVFFQRSPSSDPTALQPQGTVTQEVSPNDPDARAAVEQAAPRAINDETASLAVRRRPAQQPNLWVDTPPSANDVRTLPEPQERRHVIEDGDTLFSLARRYYDDGERFIDIYRANRNVLTNPDRLPVGTAIRIP